ncbi:hypothetical protein OH76DRAFT_769582 [Lentinus brumalis]|uniref:Uncharacterized protein n=1 Tax=Lentinus brumalis TaxID=2498619 RepID=A0A371D4Q8_9APHY|nr:hypothetical protein OH76DRAFT_769582 [Polyporus brumalis]
MMKWPAGEEPARARRTIRFPCRFCALVRLLRRSVFIRDRCSIYGSLRLWSLTAPMVLQIPKQGPNICWEFTRHLRKTADTPPKGHKPPSRS